VLKTIFGFNMKDDGKMAASSLVLLDDYTEHREIGTHPLLAPRSRKSRAIPLPTL
jgi:hypothetical protein